MKPDLSHVRPLTHWATVGPIDLGRSTFARVLGQVAEVACTCAHPADHHPLEVLRVLGNGLVLEFRLGACQVRDCRCRGGRP